MRSAAIALAVWTLAGRGNAGDAASRVELVADVHDAGTDTALAAIALSPSNVVAAYLRDVADRAYTRSDGRIAPDALYLMVPPPAGPTIGVRGPPFNRLLSNASRDALPLFRAVRLREIADALDVTTILDAASESSPEWRRDTERVECVRSFSHAVVKVRFRRFLGSNEYAPFDSARFVLTQDGTGWHITGIVRPDCYTEDPIDAWKRYTRCYCKNGDPLCNCS